MKTHPIVLWALACQAWLPIDSAWAQAAAPSAPAGASAVREPAHPVATGGYTTSVQAGVRENSYDLVPLAEHDAARTQSMIDGIAGRDATRRPAVGVTAGEGAQQGGSPSRLVGAALWLPGLMVIVLMIVRRRRRALD
jgi:hypothetical protein